MIDKNKVVNTKMFTTMIQKALISDPSFEKEIQNMTDKGPFTELDDSFLSENNSIPSDDHGNSRPA